MKDSSIGAQEVQNVGKIERLASVVIGSFFLLNAFRRGLLSTGSKLGLSAFFLKRGLTGNCPIYSYTEQSGPELKEDNTNRKIEPQLEIVN